MQQNDTTRPKLQQQSYAVSKRWGSYVDNIRKESPVTTNLGFVVKTYAGSSKERITL